jgi:hypothetical protein
MAAPPGAVADVTDDDRFSGGTLAETSPAQLQALLEGLGVTGFVGPGRLGREAPVHREDGSGRVGRLVRSDEGDGGGDLFRRGESPCGS